VAGAAGHLEDPEWVRALVGLAAGSDSNVELPLAWLLGATEAAAFVDTAGPMPAPFTLQESGIGWSVKKDLRLVEPVTPSDAIRATARAGLVTMWRDGQSRCLIDIVAARSVALEGPPVAVGYTLSDVVVELTTRRWSDVDEVYLVGFGREMHGLQGVRYLPTVADAAALVARDRPGRHGSRCFVVAPINVHHDREDDLRRLLRLVEQTPATGVICCDTTVRAHATWQLVAHRQTLRMEVRGRTGPSAVLTPDRWVERTGVRVRLAARSITEATFDVVAAREPRAGGIEVRGCPPVASGVDVLVLGPVQVNGAAESFEGRPVLTELVVYLAFHPEGLPGESFATTLWPERRVPQQTLSNRLHEARRALGKTQSDGPRLTRADGRHLLAPDVRTDWSRFVAFTGPASGPASWRQALALVRGRPFDGLAKGDWAVFEGFVGAIEAAAVSVAARLSQHLLGLGDPLGAESALRSGLLVAPWDERLYRLLMVAADAAGNRGGVESALRSLAQVLDCAGDPLEIVHPETAALYGRLTNDRRPTGSPGTH
jgi:DNA-binding SARP family transcriptional activator